MIRHLGARRFAAIDPEEFHIYTEQRPTISTTRSGSRRITWPKYRFYAWRPDDPDERDVVIMLGAEPQMRWRRFSSVVLDVVKTCNVEVMVTLGALLDAVPHTRPPRVSSNASSKALAPDLGHIQWGPSRYEGPTGITSVLIEALGKVGIESASIWAHAPHYLQVRPNPVVTLSLVQAAQQFISQPIDVERLRTRSDEFASTVEKALEDQDQVKGYVRQLEQKYDSDADEEEEQGPFIESGDADALVADVEEFLRNGPSRPDNGDPPIG
jgi:proteasome assembly chaperone (PAC2) family protein